MEIQYQYQFVLQPIRRIGGAYDVRLALIPAQVESLKLLSQDPFVKSSIKWKDTTQFAENGDELIDLDLLQYFPVQRLQVLQCALFGDAHYH